MNMNIYEAYSMKHIEEWFLQFYIIYMYMIFHLQCVYMLHIFTAATAVVYFFGTQLFHFPLLSLVREG